MIIQRATDQTREDVVASFIRDCRSLGAGGVWIHGNLDPRQNGATLILDSAANLSRSRLRPTRSACQHKSKQTGQYAYANAVHFPTSNLKNEADEPLKSER